MQGLFKFKNNIFATDSISQYAKECKDFEHLKNTYPQEESSSISINLKA